MEELLKKYKSYLEEESVNYSNVTTDLDIHEHFMEGTIYGINLVLEMMCMDEYNMELYNGDAEEIVNIIKPNKLENHLKKLIDYIKTGVL